MISPKDIGIALIITLSTKTLVDTYVRYKNGLARLNSCPGKHHLWVHPFSTLGIALAPIFPRKGWMACYAQKFSPYAKQGSTILSALVIWDSTLMFWLADAEAIKTVTSDRHTFRKEVEVYDVLEIYGRNLVSTEGDEWRRHVAIVGPAFNEANYALAWDETLRIVHEWFEELDSRAENSTSQCLDVNAATMRATLLVISVVGFGRRMSWNSVSSLTNESDGLGPSLQKKGVMPFHKAVSLTIEKIFVKVLTPNFAYALPFRIPIHMEDLAAAARIRESGQADLLRRLVKANDATLTNGGTSTKGTLSADELFSNIFVFLLAGHETSGHTLSFAIMLLALYPETQRKLREGVLQVWPSLDDCAMSSSARDFDRLEYTLAVVHETLRCFPSEPRLNKIVEKETMLTGTKFSPVSPARSPQSSYDGGLTNVQFTYDESNNHRFTIHIPKGSTVTRDIWALHMNPLYWGDDAHTFRPERFIDSPGYKWPRDAFLPFSAGARGCIGQKLAMTESVCLLACLVRRFEILLPEDVNVGKLTEADKRRLLAWKTGVTITPTNAIVELRRRVMAARDATRSVFSFPCIFLSSIMYSIHLLSLIFLLFISSASATSNAAYPVSDQFPLIARVGQPYSWSISTETFATSASDIASISASPLPSWLSFSNYTFSGTPGPQDEASINVTLQVGDARDSFTLCVTHFPPPTVHIPLSDQFNSSNPSMSSVFPIGDSSALKDDNPALRVPLRWSFSVGFEYATFVNELNLFYYAQLANGSRLPDWLSFDNKTVTFDGVARSPPLAEGDKVELVLIASDQEGYSAVREPFDLFIQSHDLSVLNNLTLNLTAGEDFELDLRQSTWLFEGIMVDNSSFRADNISSLSVDTSSASWISFDSESRILVGTAPSTGSFSLPMTFSAFNESVAVNATIFLVPSYFHNATLQDSLASPGTDFSLNLSPYLSSNPYFSGHNISLSANSSASSLNITSGQDGSYSLSGRISGSPGASHFDVQLTAYDHTVHVASHATLRISTRFPNSDAAAQEAIARHRRLVLGLSIGLGGATGLVLFAGFFALVRKCCRVQDTAMDVNSLEEKARGSSDTDMERDGYGWSAKAGLGLSEAQPACHARYQGVGIGYTPSLVPGSPPAKRITKGAFFNSITATVRKFSAGARTGSARKSTISKPVLMFTKHSNENLSALRAAAGLDDAGGVYACHDSAPDSMDAPPGDGISLGLSSGLGSSPTSTTGHSNETGKASIPRQRADFGPSRPGNVSSTPRGHDGLARKSSHSRCRSTDTHTTLSFGDREHDAELAEAVIVTASRATSLRSARSSAYSCVPSTYARDSVHVGGATQVARPRLVPFTNARGVPVPTPTLNSQVGPAGPREQRRISQIAAVVSGVQSARSKPGAHETDADAIMTEGMRYVRAFGDQDTELETTRPSNLGQPSSEPPPSRSNSKRSSRSMSRVQEGVSPTQTQSSYVYPSPSQSIESSVKREGGSRGSRGSRGSLMMSRILVRSGEAFAFKYPIALASSSENKLVARLLYGGSHLPSFLSHTISLSTPSFSSSGKKRRIRYEVEFWGTPSSKDIGEAIVGIFVEGGNGECVGRLVVEVVPRGS